MPFLPLPFASSVVFGLLNLILQSISFSYNISSSSLTWSKFTKKEPSCVLVCSSSKDSQTSSAFYIKVSALSLRLSFLFFFLVYIRESLFAIFSSIAQKRFRF